MHPTIFRGLDVARAWCAKAYVRNGVCVPPLLTPGASGEMRLDVDGLTVVMRWEVER